MNRDKFASLSVVAVVLGGAARSSVPLAPAHWPSLLPVPSSGNLLALPPQAGLLSRTANGPDRDTDLTGGEIITKLLLRQLKLYSCILSVSLYSMKYFLL